MTLLELLAASIIGLVVILAIGQVDVTRILLSQRIRSTTTVQSEAGLALANMARSLQLADRLNLIGADNIQFRVPPEALVDLDNPAAYQWSQYKLSGTEIQLFENTNNAGCGGAADQKFTGISGLVIQYKDEAPPPPGGGPLEPQDNNVLEVQLTSPDPGGGAPIVYTGEITTRAAAYTNVTSGLLPPGQGGPPAGC